MYPIMFAFRSSVAAEEQESILGQVSKWEEVASAGRVAPDATEDEEKRACFVYVKDELQLAHVAHRLSQLAEIECSSTPAERRLIW